MSYARSNEAPDAAKAVNPAAGQPSAPPASGGEGGRVFSSPLARRLAKMDGIDLGAIQGTGPHGRVIARDVQAAKAGGGLKAPAPQAAAAEAPKAAAPAPKAAPAGGAPAGLTTDQVKGFYAKDAYEEVPLDGMRKTIAKRLTEAMQVAPHFYLTVDCELDALMSLRETLNGSPARTRTASPPSSSR